MNELMKEVMQHLEGDRKTWKDLMNDAKETSFKTALTNKIYQVAKEEAESDQKLLEKLREVIE
jgi:hypothetical protein